MPPSGTLPGIGPGSLNRVSLSLYDTASRATSAFTPLIDGEVGIYVCGATVQSAPHVGHMRAAVAFDVLQRWLERSGYRVTMVRNVTDIDDKILAKAADAGQRWWERAFIYERAFTEAYDALGVLRPTAEPRATGHITDMVSMIGELIERGHAYEAHGSVYFDVRSWPSYGSLTRQALDDLEAAADTDDAAASVKKDPRDFALWKASRAGEPETASWPSPWGRGRPGWHIECSAMAARYLGGAFDIHGGGLDLRFPHHENEQAQSQAAGHAFAARWMHSAWVTQAGEKMSKSLGNGLGVDEVLARFGAPALRLALAQVHYRSMLEFSDATMEDAAATWQRLDSFVRRTGETSGADAGADLRAVMLPAAFTEAMDDDLGVPRAMAVIHETVRAANTAMSAGDATAAAAGVLAVRAMLDVFGLDPLAEPWASAGTDESPALDALDVLVKAEIEARGAARAAKDWGTADAIRDRLSAAGVVVEDGAEGARWHLG